MRTSLALLALVSACAEPTGMVDITARTGIEFTHDQGFRETYYFPETVGSGVALIDVDGDGDLDVYALQCGLVPNSREDEENGDPRPVNRMFLNDGRARFTDVTDASGAAAHDGYAMGVCAGDVNGDGRVDLFVTNFGPDALLVQREALRFEDLAAGTPLADERWTTAAGFADLDRDGHLDLVVTGYVRFSWASNPACQSGGTVDYCDVNMFDAIRDRLWRGDGRGGFVEVTDEWGPIGNATTGYGKGLGLALVDFDDDGDVDAYVANDSVKNHLFLNDGAGKFEDATFSSGAAYNVDGRTEAGMGVAVADVDGNGLPDVLVTNFAGESNTLYGNDGGGHFRDRSRSSGLTAWSRLPLGFGTVFTDLDLDGIEDLVVSNGHVLRHVHEQRELWTYAQPAQLFRGLGAGRFEPWDAEAAGPAIQVPRVGRGLAQGDLDGDGAPELVFNGSGEKLLVLGDRLVASGSTWLGARLRGEGTNTSAIGARVRLVLAAAGDAEQVQTRWVRSGTGFLSQDDLRPRFGIPAGLRPKRLEVRWPDGSESVVEAPAPGTYLDVTQPGA